MPTKENKLITVLLTCHNRKLKTYSCLEALFNCTLEEGFDLNIFLVDDGSTDGTTEYLQGKFKNLQIIQGTGDLFWAGGMRAAWKFANEHEKNTDYFLLLNDDTIIFKDTITRLLRDLKSVENSKSIIVGPTSDPDTKKISYGGHQLLNRLTFKSKMLIPNDEFPQKCELGNANIMLVPKEVYQEIGSLTESYTHGIADFDYTLKALKKGIKTYISSSYCGYCTNDHGVNWLPQDSNLKERIAYLYSPTGLSYKEYIQFVKVHFPFHLPQAFLLLWGKTLFPIIWQLFKNEDYLK
ncbi:glycosyltransferase family 2 protein [Maribacter stanieri]|uniref:Glycosyltransferase, GT2 family n=1 Tax=Maribacter stanieri TaxID=440514 RepID=A0A1I6I660_9FLAO|nr:glycosyltransferase [Maribacter stanieri]SFR62128.1 Glycosyltransferase, GT2 family [Maribacter stanieri]